MGQHEQKTNALTKFRHYLRYDANPRVVFNVFRVWTLACASGAAYVCFRFGKNLFNIYVLSNAFLALAYLIALIVGCAMLEVIIVSAFVKYDDVHEDNQRN